MRTYIYIGVGGFLGAVLRYTIKNWQMLNIFSPFPFDIFIINMAGCFALAFFLRLAFDIWEVDPDVRLGISTGFLGAFTTFSTFCRDIVSLFLGGHLFYAATNAILSVTVGAAAVYLGDVCGKRYK